MYKKLFYFSLLIIFILTFSLAHVYSNYTDTKQLNTSLEVTSIKINEDILKQDKQINTLQEKIKGNEASLDRLYRELKIYENELNKVRGNDSSVMNTRVIRLYKLSDIAPWIKSNNFSEIKIISTNTPRKKEIYVPKELINIINYSDLFGEITYIRESSFYYFPPNNATYKYVFTIDNEDHYIEIKSDKVIVIDGLWIRCDNRLFSLGDAFMENEIIKQGKQSCSLEEQLFYSTLVTVDMNEGNSVYFTDIRKWRINGFCYQLLYKSNIIDNIPITLSANKYSFTFYNHGSKIELNSYGDYAELLDYDSGKSIWYYRENLENDLIMSLVAGG